MPTIEFLWSYFTSPLSILTFSLLAGTSGGSYLVFKFHEDPALRSRSLFTMFASSLLFWTFIASSLILCEVYEWFYVGNLTAEIKFVSGMALISSFGIAVPFAVLVTRTAPQIFLERILKGKSTRSLDASRFQTLSREGKFKGVRLLEVEEASPWCFAVDSRERSILISTGLTSLLESPEVEAVVTHELIHLKNRDVYIKTLARTYSRLLRFDPIIRLIEVAICRELELAADKAAASISKPLNLASALIKIQEIVGNVGGGTMPSLVAQGGSRWRLLRRYPDLNTRVERLLRMA